MSSKRFITLSCLTGDDVDNSLQSSNLGNCFTTFPEKADTIAGAIAFVNV